MDCPISAIDTLPAAGELLVRYHLVLRYGFILRSSVRSHLQNLLDYPLWIPTMTAPSARGLPHSLVSKHRRSASPVLSDSVSRSLPVADSKPPWAALLKASVHAAMFAA